MADTDLSKRENSSLLAWGALASVYVVWGSTYLAIRVAVDTMPPFLMAGVRYVAAGVILYLPSIRTAVRQGKPRPAIAHWRSAAIIGALLLVGGNGLVSWAEQKVDSNVAALIVGTVPLWLLVFDRLLGKVKSGWPAVAGLIVGLGGVAILVGPGATQAVDTAGAAAVLFASFFWAIGSIQTRRLPLPASSSLATAMEMLAGGAVLLVVALATGEFTGFQLSKVSLDSVVGLLWLIGPGSILGFTAYTYSLRNLPTATVGTYAYVNPVIAVVLGWWILNERVTLHTLIGGGVIVLSVVFILGVRKREEVLAVAGSTPAGPPIVSEEG